MKLLLENWKKFLTEAKKYICPPATQDLELNTKNRDSAIKAEQTLEMLTDEGELTVEHFEVGCEKIED